MPAAEPAADAPATAPQPDASTGHRALYRKFRAQRFGELIGQDPIVTTLRRAVTGDRLAHAYLFVGPRGTGKTSTARILAKAINCTDLGADGEPCDACAACVGIREGRALDVIEIDAASHGAVEDARDLVMRALTSPSELRKRVYIIDEVHMLSSHAFNALLKLIEEPPDHVVFILATTDTHKVPATIISRTQRHDFRRLTEATIVGKLARICSAEAAEADDDALALIARLADGGMRDAESLLDQVLAYADGRVTVSEVRDAVGLADDAAVAGLVDAYLAADAPAALDIIAGMADAGRDLAQVAAQAEEESRRRLLASAADPGAARRLAVILRSVAEAAGVGAREGRARLTLELLAVDVAAPTPAAAASRSAPARAPAAAIPSATPPPAPGRTTPSATAAALDERATPSPAESKAGPTSTPATTAPATSAQTTTAPATTPVPIAATGGSTGVEELRANWAAVIERASPVIKPLLKECRPIARDGARLTLAFPEGRDFMRSNIQRRAGQIETLLTDMFGGPFAVECVASNVELEPLTVEQAVGAPADDLEARALLDGVLKITGGELVDAPEVR